MTEPVFVARLDELKRLLSFLDRALAGEAQLCETGLDSSGFYRVGLAVAAYGLGDYPLARQHFHSWLGLRIPENQPTVILLGLPITALLLAHDGDLERAAEVLGLAFQHPASLTGWLEKWPLLTRFRAELAGELGAETFAAAGERGRYSDLNACVAALIDYFQAEKALPLAHSHAANRPFAAPLSERELEVLRLVAEGLSNPEIAQKLFLSPGTVKVHIRHIYDKLDVNSRVQAAARAKTLNLL